MSLATDLLCDIYTMPLLPPHLRIHNNDSFVSLLKNMNAKISYTQGISLAVTFKMKRQLPFQWESLITQKVNRCHNK